jgi:hypothetical protein
MRRVAPHRGERATGQAIHGINAHFAAGVVRSSPAARISGLAEGAGLDGAAPPRNNR